VFAATQERWITFDCYGTLVDWQTGFASILAPLVGDRTTDVIRAYHDCERLVEGTTPHRTYKNVLATCLVRAAARLGVRLSEKEANVLPESWASLPLFDDVETLLAELRRRGYRLGVLTNCDDDLFEMTHRIFARPFDLFVTAERIRSYKPAPWHFRGFARLAGVSQSDWVHVASSPYHDIGPASALGINGVWLDRNRTAAGCAPGAAHVHSAVEVVEAAERLFDSSTSRCSGPLCGS
jgi:2-haloacid dehalogenase